MKRQRKIIVAVVVVVVVAFDHSACLFVQTFVNFIELSLTRHISSIGRFDGRRSRCRSRSRSRSRLWFWFQLRFILETI